MDYFEFIKELVDPQSIIKYGGLFLLLAVVFAETGLLVGFFLPGDSLLFIAGLFCATDVLDYHILVILGSLILAAVSGNSVGYFLGNKLGPRLFTKEESLLFKPRYLVMTTAFYEKYGKRAIIIGRFLPIFRTFIPVFAGAISFDRKKFFAYNVAGAFAWVCSLVLAGFFIGYYFPWVGHYLEYIVIFLIVITTIPLVRTYIKEKKANKENENG